MDPEEALIDGDGDGGDGAEGELEESTKLKMFRRVASVASKLKEFIGNMITTAGKVVVTVLLGSSGECVPAAWLGVWRGQCRGRHPSLGAWHVQTGRRTKSCSLPGSGPDLVRS